MKTIQMNEQLVRSMDLSSKERRTLKRNLGVLQGLTDAIRGFPTPRGEWRTERAILIELETLRDLGRNLAWGFLPTEVGLACFQFRMEAIVRAALQFLSLSDADRP